jgi:hypothetical protein
MGDMTKGEIRRARQAEHAARESARLAAGDTRSAAERHADLINATAKRRHRRSRRPSSRSPIVGSAEWAETRGDDLPSLDQPGDDYDTDY